MSATTAAVVLAWMALLVLAFALAGTLKQLRDVQAALVELGARVGRSVAPRQLRPSSADRRAAVLLVDRNCAVCPEVLAEFLRLAPEVATRVDATVLSHADDERWEAVRRADAVRLVVDRAAYHQLDPGWRPAVLSIDAQGSVRSAIPAGSGEALREAVQVIASRSPAGRT
jgi:hypothetical protein